MAGSRASGRSVLGAVARAVLDGSLPDDGDAQRAALPYTSSAWTPRCAAVPPATQREVGDLLALLALPPGRLALAGLAIDWPRADVWQVQSALQSMRSSRFALRQQVYHALRDLTHAAYFADRATWVRLGYPGPTTIA